MGPKLITTQKPKNSVRRLRKQKVLKDKSCTVDGVNARRPSSCDDVIPGTSRGTSQHDEHVRPTTCEKRNRPLRKRKRLFSLADAVRALEADSADSDVE